MSNSTNPQLSKIFKIKFQSSKHIVNIGEVDVLILVHIHFLDIYNTSLSHVYLSDFSTEMLQWRLYDIQPHYVSNLWFLKMKKSKPNYRHQSCHQINWKNKQTNNKTNQPSTTKSNTKNSQNSEPKIFSHRWLQLVSGVLESCSANILYFLS